MPLIPRYVRLFLSFSLTFLYHAYPFSSGVKSFDVSLENQTATVVTEPSVSYETVLEKIKKTGKTVNSGEAGGQTMPV